MSDIHGAPDAMAIARGLEEVFERDDLPSSDVRQVYDANGDLATRVTWIREERALVVTIGPRSRTLVKRGAGPGWGWPKDLARGGVGKLRWAAAWLMGDPYQGPMGPFDPLQTP